MWGCCSEGDGRQLCLETCSMDLWPHSSCCQFTCWNSKLKSTAGVGAHIPRCRRYTWADGWCFIYRLMQNFQFFPHTWSWEASRSLLGTTVVGGNLTSKMTAHGTPSQSLIICKKEAVKTQPFMAIYAKWGQGHVWKESVWNKLIHVQWLMSVGWWKLTGCIVI